MDHEKMTVLVIEPEKKPYVKDISSGLASLQKEVGGYIQPSTRLMTLLPSSVTRKRS